MIGPFLSRFCLQLQDSGWVLSMVSCRVPLRKEGEVDERLISLE